jgi:hypothetical protein
MKPSGQSSVIGVVDGILTEELFLLKRRQEAETEKA